MKARDLVLQDSEDLVLQDSDLAEAIFDTDLGKIPLENLLDCMSPGQLFSTVQTFLQAAITSLVRLGVVTWSGHVSPLHGTKNACLYKVSLRSAVLARCGNCLRPTAGLRGGKERRALY